MAEFRGTPLKKTKKSKAPSQVKPEAKAGQEQKARGIVYVPQGTLVRPVYVDLGLSDGSLTEVASPELKEGTALVVGEMENQPAGETVSGRQPLYAATLQEGR